MLKQGPDFHIEISSYLGRSRDNANRLYLHTWCILSLSVVVGSMNSVENLEDSDKTHIEVAVSQILRQRGSHFHRHRRDSSTLHGIIVVPKKCGVVKGDGLFLMTGKLRFGELKLGCAPYLQEWEALARAAEMDGRMQCSRDWNWPQKRSATKSGQNVSLPGTRWLYERRVSEEVDGTTTSTASSAALGSHGLLSDDGYMVELQQDRTTGSCYMQDRNAAGPLTGKKPLLNKWAAMWGIVTCASRD